MKKCSKCGIIKELNQFHKDKNSKDGYKVWCKECRQKETKKYREKNKDKLSKSKKEWYQSTKLNANLRNEIQLKIKNKKCSKCNKIKPILDFRNRANGGFYSVCRECENIRNKEYKINNPTKINELRVIHENRRRYKKNNLAKNFTQKEWNECKKFFNNKCAYCGKEMKNLTQDHFIPLSSEGEYTKYNIIPCCRSCNSSKHDKNFYEWYINYPFYSKSRIEKIEEYFRSLK